MSDDGEHTEATCHTLYSAVLPVISNSPLSFISTDELPTSLQSFPGTLPIPYFDLTIASLPVLIEIATFWVSPGSNVIL